MTTLAGEKKDAQGNATCAANTMSRICIGIWIFLWKNNHIPDVGKKVLFALKTENMNEEQPKYRNFFWDNLKIILAITCVCLAFLLFRQCNAKKAVKQEIESVRAFLSDSIDYYENKTGQLVAEKKALQGSNNTLSSDNQVLQVLLSKQIDSTRQLTNLVKNFKTIDAAGNITLETELKDIEIPFDEPLGFTFFRRWSKKTPHYFISGLTSGIGTTIYDLRLNTIISFGIGEKNTGFFQNEYRFEATSSNPYISITGLDGATFSTPRKRFGLSLYAGYGLGRDFSFTPQIGIGLSYTFLYF